MADMNESTRLINNLTPDLNDGLVPNRLYGTNNGSAIDTATAAPFTQGPSEQPEPYQEPAENGIVNVTCRVCQAQIDITNKRDQHVVKCNQCNEATPIRNAPNGKKYVRCPCNCLLICRTASLKIACPRPNCKRIINLQSSPITPPIPFTPGLCKVSCAHCHDSFLFNTLNNYMARCPHCQKVSSVGIRFARIRFILYLMSIFACLVVTILVAVFFHPFAMSHTSFFIVYILLLLLFLILFRKLIYFYRVKVSIVEESM